MLNLKRILHPTDFSDNSNQALKYACSLATQFGAELHIIHVAQNPALLSSPANDYLPADYYDRLQRQVNEQLASLPDEVLSFTGSVTRNLCSGVPFVEIIRYAKENAIDMIVMGTHGYSGLKHLIIGSVAENVVRKSPCPVLTVHPENYEFVMP
ncbi:MAG: universal stress protein [Gammaproteobacteria bacterium]|jgi:universal stress protein A